MEATSEEFETGSRRDTGRATASWRDVSVKKKMMKVSIKQKTFSQPFPLLCAGSSVLSGFNDVVLCSVLVAICDDMCKTIIATALLLSFIVSILLSSYFIHRYHKNSPKAPIASAEMTFRRPVQSYPISFPGNNVRRGSQESIETDTFKIPVSEGARLTESLVQTVIFNISVFVFFECPASFFFYFVLLGEY